MIDPPAQSPARPIAATTETLPRGLAWWGWAAAVLLAILILFSRRPDAFLNPQFFAEDGNVWFAEAYNHGGLAVYFHPLAGYFQSLPRLIGSLSMLFPFSLAPLVFLLCGLAIQIAVPLFLLSHRMAAWGSLTLRAAMAFTCLTVPCAWEVHLSTTESQWHLSLLAVLLLVAAAPRGRLGWLFSLGVILLSGLSGPFAMFLAPLAVLLARLRRQRYHALAAVLLLVTAVIQAIAQLALSHPPRNPWPLGASLEWLVRLVAGNVFLASLLGANVTAVVAPFFLMAAIFVAGVCLCAYSLRRMRLEARLFFAYVTLILAGSLANPVTHQPPAGSTVWMLLGYDGAAHYWFLPVVAFQWMILWLPLGDGAGRDRRHVGAVLLAVLAAGILFHWRLPAFEDTHFRARAAACQAAPSGTLCVFPENPAPWSFSIVKR